MQSLGFGTKGLRTIISRMENHMEKKNEMKWKLVLRIGYTGPDVGKVWSFEVQG